MRLEAIDVFNLPLSEGFLVLDLRGRERYERSHLIGAWLLDGEDDLAELLERVGDENPPEQLSTVVVCSTDGRAAAARLLETLEKAQPASPFHDRLLRRLERVGSFEDVEAFLDRYPFLRAVGPEPIAAGVLAPVLPVLLAERGGGAGALYLGSQAHALSQEAHALLEIGAVVNATEEVAFLEREEAPPARLRCSLRDDELQDLAGAFATSDAFLSEHRHRNRLVHCSRGRNRSAALAAHHLFRSGEVATPAAAVARVRGCRRMALENASFVAQLEALAPSGV